MREDKKYKQMLIVLIVVFTGILLLRAVPRQSRIYQSSNNIYTLPDKERRGSDVSQPTQKNKQKNKKSNMKILYYGSSADTVEFLKNYDTIEELAQDANNIVFGIVNDKNSYMDEEGDTVYTDQSVELKKVYKGKLKEKLEEKENIHIKEDENSNVKWLEINKLEDYISLNDIEMLPIYKKILNLKQIFAKNMLR